MLRKALSGNGALQEFKSLCGSVDRGENPKWQSNFLRPMTKGKSAEDGNGDIRKEIVKDLVEDKTWFLGIGRDAVDKFTEE